MKERKVIISTNYTLQIETEIFPVLLIFPHVSFYPVQEGGDPGVDSRSAHPAAPAAEGHDANQVPGLAGVRILQVSLPPEESSARVSVARVLPKFSPGTDLCGGIYPGSGRTVSYQNRDLNI